MAGNEQTENQLDCLTGGPAIERGENSARWNTGHKSPGSAATELKEEARSWINMKQANCAASFGTVWSESQPLPAPSPQRLPRKRQVRGQA